MIRFGEKSAFVEAVFIKLNSVVLNFLKESLKLEILNEGLNSFVSEIKN